MDNLKDILNSSDFRFKKKFGQNFITDKNLLSAIAEDAGIEGENVIEIGCGGGTLTLELALRAKQVTGYEIDKDLKTVLDRVLEGKKNVSILYIDIMKVKTEELDRLFNSYTVVANLPYYITTPIIMKFVEESKNIKRMVVMVQEEVAKRLTAKPDTADYGSITAAVDIRGDAKILRTVSRKMFYPVPNVDSAVIGIDFTGCKYGLKDTKAYREVVRAAFSSRRKTLANNLMQAFKLSREQAEGILEKAGIEKMARGEALSSEQFARLANSLMKKEEK